MKPEDAYAWLKEHYRETALFESCAALLHWDLSTMIPPAGHAHRTEQLTTLTGLIHERNTDPGITEALEACLDLEAAPDSPEAVNLHWWRRLHDRALKIPHDLARALARACTSSEAAWFEARKADDWASFRPHLEEIVRLRLREAEAVGYDAEPYDALLDEYEPGETAAGLEDVFAALLPACRDLAKGIRDCGRLPEPILRRTFPVDDQKKFSLATAKALGFLPESGRLDVSAHPFSTTIGPGDARITTRFNQRDFGDGFFSTVHEVGHALYELGLPPEHWGSPRGTAISLGVHESQSRLWENMAARSKGFWRHFLPLAQERFPDFSDVGLSAMHFAVNEVRPGLIRVDADEVTYNLHVALRFELERAMLSGDLAVADLPGAWNEKMDHHLGLTPPDHASGVMQDVHWAAGILGYFPTYTLGNVYAAQLYSAAARDLGDLEAMFSQGEFAMLLDWLRDRVHKWGMTYAPRELIRRATGRERDPADLVEHLTAKYRAVYRLRD